MAFLVLAWLAPGFERTASAQTVTTCAPAATKGADGPVDFGAYCWIDFSGLNLTSAKSGSGQPFQVNLRGGRLPGQRIGDALGGSGGLVVRRDHRGGSALRVGAEAADLRARLLHRLPGAGALPGNDEGEVEGHSRRSLRISIATPSISRRSASTSMVG